MTDQDRIKRLAEIMVQWNAMNLTSYEAYGLIRNLFTEEIRREWQIYMETIKVTRK